MTTAVKASALKEPRDVLVCAVKVAKEEVISMLQTGVRDANAVREQVERYIAFQIACDVLGGYDNWKVTFE